MRACFGVFETVENGGGQSRNRLGFRAVRWAERDGGEGGAAL